MTDRVLPFQEAIDLAGQIYDGLGNGSGYAPFLKEENLWHIADLFGITYTSAIMLQDMLKDLHEGKAIE